MKRKCLWIISHDSVLDHRLFFFEKYFRSLGFDVFFISGPFIYEGYSAFEKENVIRPEVKSLFYDFENSNDLIKYDSYGIINLYNCLKAISESSSIFKQGQNVAKHHFNSIFEKYFGKENAAFSVQDERLYFRARSQLSPYDLEFDSLGTVISKISNVPEVKPEFRSFNGFDQEEFIKHVYNYTPIYNAAERALEAKTIGSPDLIYVSDLPTLPMAIEYKKRFAVPLVVDCHEWWKEQFLIWGNGDKETELLFDRYERLLYKEADMLLTVGVNLASYMQTYFNLPFHCIYTCDSIGYIRNTQQKEFWKNEIPDYKGERVLLFQGSITPQRNIEAMVEIGKNLNENVLMVVVGAGSFTPEFIRLIKENKAGGKIKYLGWQNQERLLEFTHYADLGFIPYVAKSRYYSCGAPNKLFEFVSAQLPVVYHNSMLEIEDVVGKNGFGFSVDYSDPKVAANKISSYISNDDLLNKAKLNYQKQGSYYFYEGQKNEFEKILKQQGLV